jgi:hypothetical protein
MNNSSQSALHFNTNSYPRFGRGVYSDLKAPSTVKSSPFFWWFKFLQLNSDYIETEKNNGVGKCSDLYKDFGAVSNTDFKTWWREHSHLFAEAKTNYSLRVAKTFAELAPFDSTEAVNIVVPLNWSQKSLKKHFALLLPKIGVASGDIGPKIGISKSTAKYGLGRRWNCGAMESAYDVYKVRQANMEKGAKTTTKAQHKGTESAKFKMAWADVGIEAKLDVAEGMEVGKVKQDTAEKRRVLTILAKRHYEKALGHISAAATATFPKTE